MKRGNIRKKILHVSLITLLTVCGVGLTYGQSVFADDTVASGVLGDNLTWTLDSAGTLTVQGEGETYDFGLPPHTEIPFSEYSDKIVELVLPEGITKIGRYAFGELNNLTGTLVLPSTVKEIGSSAFSNCRYKKIVFPDSLESVGSLAFCYDHELEEINIPQNLVTLERSAFDGCEKLVTVTCESDCLNFCVVDGVLFSKNMEDLVLYPCALPANNYVVPNGVKSIIHMSICPALNSITLPDSIETIGEGAFCWDGNLETINFPEGLISIGESAFYNCSNISGLDLPQSLKQIDSSAFLGCKNLSEVIFRSKDCKIKDIKAPKTTILTGFLDTTSYVYAKNNGYEFHNIENGELVLHVLTNQDWINLLPTEGVELSEPLQPGSAGEQDPETGKLTNLQFNVDRDFINLDDSIRNQIIEKVEELTKDCSTDYEKAKAIYTFVNAHMTYVMRFYSLKHAWQNGEGNCMTYAVLTATMLYYAGIPNAYAMIPGHVINLALCDDRWVDIDSQSKFDRGGDAHDDFTGIIMKSGDLIFYTDDFSGMKLGGIGSEYSEVDEDVMNRGITIPEWVVGHNKINSTPSGLSTYKGIEIRGRNGTDAEDMAIEMGYKCFVKDKSGFVAHLDHSMPENTEWSKDADNHWYICETCEQIADKDAHTWDYKYTTDKEASCTENGSKSIHCSICNAVKDGSTMVIEKKAHDYGDWKVTKEATCTEDGSKEKECSVCRDKVTAVIKATGHNYGSWEVTKKVTCTEDGSVERVCSKCNNIMTGVIMATGHKWDEEYTTDKDATYTEDGSKSIHCSVCNQIKEGSQKVIPKLVKEVNTMTVKAEKKTVKAKKLKKKARTVEPITVSDAKGTVTYEIVGGTEKSKKALKINSESGAIKVKKKTMKGTYKVTVKVTAAGTTEGFPQYEIGERTVWAIVRVK